MIIDNMYFEELEMDSYLREYLFFHFGKTTRSGEQYLEFSPSMTEYKFLYQWLSKPSPNINLLSPQEVKEIDPAKRIYIALPLKSDKHPRDGWQILGDAHKRIMVKQLKLSLEVAISQDYKISYSNNPNMVLKDFLECWAEKNGITTDKAYYAIDKKLFRMRNHWRRMDIKI